MGGGKEREKGWRGGEGRGRRGRSWGMGEKGRGRRGKRGRREGEQSKTLSMSSIREDVSPALKAAAAGE